MKTKRRSAVKKKDVVEGGIYVAKISGQLTLVRILSPRHATKPSGAGWFAFNLSTGKRIIIKSAQKLRLDLQKFFGVADLINGRFPHETPNPAQEAGGEDAARPDTAPQGD